MLSNNCQTYKYKQLLRSFKTPYRNLRFTSLKDNFGIPYTLVCTKEYANINYLEFDFCRSCWKHRPNSIFSLYKQNFRFQSPFKATLTKQLKSEYRAVAYLLNRSCFTAGAVVNGSRAFHTSVPRHQQKPQNEDNKNDDEKKMLSALTKAVLWLLSGYMFVALLSLIFPTSNQPEQIIRYVSWNEFVHHMLAKGEVDQIIVRPDIDIVTIILHDGAVVKGHKIEHRTFHMNIVDMKKFEEKLRAAEERLGVGLGGGVPVVYERGADAMGKLLFSLIVAGALLSILNRTKIMRSPVSFDYFNGFEEMFLEKCSTLWDFAFTYKLARARDEWESAALQNANTRCNGLLPLWGPQVPESAFASCLARHNTYLQECTRQRDISYVWTVHDLKMLLLRFANEKSFHEDAGGGGPQSNMHLIPYLLHMALYVINTTRCGGREEKSLASYLECGSGERWLESCYKAEGPLYWATLSLCLHSGSRWQLTRLSHLRHLLTLAHVRHVCPLSGPYKLTNPTPAEYSVYKTTLVFFGLIDIIYNQYFKNVTVSSEEQWPTALADYIRHNDEALLKCSERLMAAYTEELLPCSSFDEFCDVLGLLNEITDPSSYIKDLLTGLIS